MQPRTRLDSYLRSKGLSRQEFAERVGISKGQLSRLLPAAGGPPKRRMTVDVLNRIIEATGGELRADDVLADVSRHMNGSEQGSAAAD